jgi:type IV pilus secretin PilQ/predicted competence protein
MKRTRGSWALLTAIGLAVATPGAAETSGSPVRLTDVSVDRQGDVIAVRVKTSGPAEYQATLIDSPPRLVIDLADTTYTWSKSRAPQELAPLREIRGSQWRPGVARLVIELVHPVDYRIDPGSDGLVVQLEPTGRGRNLSAVKGAPSPARKDKAASVAAEVKDPAAAVAVLPMAAVTAPVPSIAPVAFTADPPAAKAAIRVAQIQVSQAPSPASQAPGAPRLLSLDFKDAEVVNVLRILAAESGRNIVIGPDVKGKISLSLRNVTWEQALDTVLETAGLARIEKAGIIRIVSIDQLTKEREAQARAEEAQRKADIEVRTKLVEAQLKEADLAAKKAAQEAAAAEAAARGPLREETVRLSYADPDEVVRTLQGILGIPPEGTPVSGVPIGAPIGAPPLIAERPFSQLYGIGQAFRPPAPVVPVAADVLAKGLTIRAYKPTNSIFLRLYAQDLERTKKLIREQLDVPLPQVKIEARMEILDRNALEAIGVQWGGSVVGVSGRNTVVGQGFQSAPGAVPGQFLPVQGGVLQPDGSTIVVSPTSPTVHSSNPSFPLSGLFPIDSSTGLPIGGNLVNLPFQALPRAAQAIPAGGLAFGIVGSSFNINLALQALAEQGKTRTLARPEIVTVENARAEISLGQEIPYATVSSAGTQIQFKDALLKLDVTPTVIRERFDTQEITRIKMIVVVENNSAGALVNLGSGGTPPSINKRKAQTNVLVKEGERLVIGGITTAASSNTVRKVPVLGDIPVLGWLFKQNENFEEGRELVVFLTPSVLKREGPETFGPTR